jgi:hypothetical protein
MVKVKELKEDALVSIVVNKTYYFMVKSLAYSLTQQLMNENSDPQYVKDCFEKSFEHLNETQRNLQTVALLIAEIEAQGEKQNLTIEKEILEPTDEGYVAPTED